MMWQKERRMAEQCPWDEDEIKCPGQELSSDRTTGDASVTVRRRPECGAQRRRDGREEGTVRSSSADGVNIHSEFPQQGGRYWRFQERGEAVNSPAGKLGEKFASLSNVWMCAWQGHSDFTWGSWSWNEVNKASVVPASSGGTAVQNHHQGCAFAPALFRRVGGNVAEI